MDGYVIFSLGAKNVLKGNLVLKTEHDNRALISHYRKISKMRTIFFSIIIFIISALITHHISADEKGVELNFSNNEKLLNQLNTKMVLFSLPNCPACKAIKKELKQNNVIYHDINIADKSDFTVRLMEDYKVKRVPKVITKQFTLIGYKQDFLINQLEKLQ